jgi:hypothetical protein
LLERQVNKIRNIFKLQLYLIFVLLLFLPFFKASEDDKIEKRLSSTFPYIYALIKEGLLLQTEKHHDQVVTLLEN